MTIETINNGESGKVVRDKINGNFGQSLNLDPTDGLQIGGVAPNAEQRAAVRAGIGVHGLAQQSMRATLARPAAPLTVHVLGNSFETSVLMWAATFAASSGALQQGKRSGFSGYRSDQIFSELQSMGIEPGSSVLAFGEGTNDASQARTTAQHVASMRQIAQYALDRGVIPIMRSSPPTDAAYSAQINAFALADRFLAESMGIPFVDNFARFVDTDGTWMAGVSVDTVHPYNGNYALAGADAWDQISGNPPPLLPRSDAGEGMFGSNVLQLAHTDNLPTGFSILGFTGHTINALTDYAFPFRGKMASISVSQSASADVYRTATASGNFSVGDTVTVSGILGRANGSNMIVSAFVRAMGPNTDFYLGTIGSDVDKYFRTSLVVPAGTTSLRLFLRSATATTGAYSGDIRWGGWDIYNVTENTFPA